MSKAEDNVDNSPTDGDNAEQKDSTNAEVNAQIGAMLSNESGPVTVEIISVRHGVCLLNMSGYLKCIVNIAMLK